MGRRGARGSYALRCIQESRLRPAPTTLLKSGYPSLVRGASTDAVDERRAVKAVRRAAGRGLTMVGMGRNIQCVLTRERIFHLHLRHPAARGRGRRRDLCRLHSREVLAQSVPSGEPQRRNRNDYDLPSGGGRGAPATVPAARSYVRQSLKWLRWQMTVKPNSSSSPTTIRVHIQPPAGALDSTVTGSWSDVRSSPIQRIRRH